MRATGAAREGGRGGRRAIEAGMGCFLVPSGRCGSDAAPRLDEGEVEQLVLECGEGLVVERSFIDAGNWGVVGVKL